MHKKWNKYLTLICKEQNYQIQHYLHQLLLLLNFQVKSHCFKWIFCEKKDVILRTRHILNQLNIDALFRTLLR